ncbi:Single-stranded DNA-binding protein (Ssb) (PDB:1EQQ) [Commensalibacter communis]|uniref:Single-stranded DNA-binding protein n=1 Tax=Commensalibacter communis TaxID=2972786 RepID=A0A9W4TNV4_9PROT|nr:single-stranded DNA-binding protein [Commensalibacter communis]CAI3953764.1 Single-stranded DNA-binding protein (Ssb) (PDB:1EQQ) [Commensalibacter communis]CAI3956416.1 Single-stranded DNA-binding protein (Ssb) (PDB:1EQQ) [Commensalibacter communis]CAI3956830.1 Single-stranded DNA-binding protein (Ssb) (PDB:1EQQ) [Commensalibacter communis]CAI3956839.1 Single-stranded DNA-binding protein (Ssb) (PDB:1EQQ) [Commensalibacter communis]
MSIGSMNRVTLIGYVGKDPEIRTTQAGKEVASFSLSTKERWNGQDHTEWHKVVVINLGLIQIIKSYVHKGILVAVEGQLKTRQYQDKKGNDRYTTEVIVPAFTGSLTMLGGKK